MSLVQLWSADPSQLETKHLQQIIAFSGDGKLRDHSAAAKEFRDLLAAVPSSVLERFVSDCLSTAFPDSGLALQDVVNEVGKRLGFEVEDGLYQGKVGHVGCDGLWRLPDGHTVVVEVKTTTAYQIDIAKLAGYRKTLAGQRKLLDEKSSVLIVVGRQDTNGLEAQIRGSRHAWETRVIGTDSLLRLLAVKEHLDDDGVIERIGGILVPREYTRVDEIVELVFSTTKEVHELPVAPPLDDSVTGGGASTEAHYESAGDGAAQIRILGKELGATFVRKSRSTWTSADGTRRAVCAVSKQHGAGGKHSFWFAFHPHQEVFLGGGNPASSWLVLGCGARPGVVAVPYSVFQSWLPDLWTTTRENGKKYWHVRLHVIDGKLMMDRRKPHGRKDVQEFVVGGAG